MRRFVFRFTMLLVSCVFLAAAINTVPLSSVSRGLWIFALLVSENGHWFAVITAILLVVSLRKLSLKSIDGLITLIFFLSSLTLFARPFYLATTNEAKWRAEFEAELGTPANETWFSVWKAWTFDVATPAYDRVNYTGRDGSQLAYDFYKAEGAGTHPVVVVVHGGGWDSGDSKQLPHLNRVLNRAGYSVASVDYRLAPGVKWPRQKEDVEDAIADLKARAVEFSLDMSGVYLLGRSAGGQIAGSVGFVNPQTCIKGFVAFYAPTDLEFGYEVSSPDDWLKPILLIEQYLGSSPYENVEPYVSSSLTKNVSPTSPPTLLLHGRPDSLSWYKHAERLKNRMKAAGAKVFFLDMPWAHHGFDYFTKGPGGQLSTGAVLSFLESQKSRCK